MKKAHEEATEEVKQEGKPEESTTENTAPESPEAGLAEQLVAAEDKYIRLVAEFDNFKKRSSKERIELFKTASQEVLTALLPVLDDFDRAIKASEKATDAAAVREGVVLISGKLKSITQKQGLKEMESIGQEFNPDLHDAITNIPAPSEELKGKVLDEVEKGYYLGDKVIRHAKVVVGA